MRSGPGRKVHLRVPQDLSKPLRGRRRPAGSKIARKFIEHAGNEWKGEVVHTGELTQLNNERALQRVEDQFGRELSA